MGNRRFSRKRLFETEKLGKPVDLEAGAGIKDAIVSATQHRNGAEIITEIALDLGTSKASISSSTTDTHPIGVASGGASYLTQLTEAKFGIITEVRAVVAEVPDSVADLDLEFGTDGDGAQGSADGTSPTSILVELDAKGVDKSNTYDAQELADKYLYVCNGAADTPEVFTQGKLLIYIHGFEAPSDI